MADFDLEVLGYSGLKQSGGLIFEEFLTDLQGIRGVRQYREMRDNSPVVGAILYLIETFTSQAEWRFEPADDSPQAKEQAEFMDGALTDMESTWEELLNSILTMTTYGWAYHEVVYKIRDGLDTKDKSKQSQFTDGNIGWRKIALRGQETLLRWEYDPGTEDLTGMHQLGYPFFTPVFVPIERALLFRVRPVKNNPEGRSVLRNSVRPYKFIKRMEEIEAIGIDRDMTGLPVLQVPPEIMSAKPSSQAAALRSQFEKMIQQIRRDEREGVIIPSELDTEGMPTGYKLSLLSSGGKRQIVTDTVIKRHESRIAMSVLAEFIMLGMDKVGSFSLASSKTNVFSMALGALLDSITDVFNRDAVPKLMGLNNVPQDLWPKLVHGDVETPPLDEIADYVLKLTQSGFNLSQPATERKLREVGGLPVEDEDSGSLLGQTPQNPTENNLELDE